MGRRIKHLQQEAYFSVLRAFHAESSDSLSWERANLMSELREELKVSSDDHQFHLDLVRIDNTNHKIRDWSQRMLGPGPSQPVLDDLPEKSKKRKISQTILPSSSSRKHWQCPPPRPSVIASGGLVGRKIRIKWPGDGKPYEAYIARYNENDGRHELLYDKGTRNETYEWVDVKEIPQEDIEWEDPKPVKYYESLGRGNVIRFVQINDTVQDAEKEREKPSEIITLLDTSEIVNKLVRMLSATPMDPREAARAKMILRDHERLLMNAIATLASDDENAGEEMQLDEPEEW